MTNLINYNQKIYFDERILQNQQYIFRKKNMIAANQSLIVAHNIFSEKNASIQYEQAQNPRKKMKKRVFRDLTNQKDQSKKQYILPSIKDQQNKKNQIQIKPLSNSSIDELIQEDIKPSNKIKQQKKRNVLLTFSQDEDNQKELGQFDREEDLLFKQSKQNQQDSRPQNSKIEENLSIENKNKFILSFDDSDNEKQSETLQQDKQNFIKSQFKKPITRKENILLNLFDQSESESQCEDLQRQKKVNSQKTEIIKVLNFRNFQLENSDFMNKKIPQNTVLQCLIRRDKKQNKYEYNVYNSLTFKHILAIKAGQIGFEFTKKTFDKEINKIVANLQSNFFGTQFKCFVGAQKNIQQIAINYQTNFLGLKGPRKMAIYLPYQKFYGNGSLEQHYKNGHNGIKKFINKSPKWNPEIGAFVLNFKGRATHSSVKNFIITDPNDDQKIYCIFGKTTKEVFNLDIKYPLTFIQGVSIAISSFDKKIACE